MRTVRLTFVFLAFGFFLAGAVFAQSSAPAPTVDPGFNPYSSLQGGDFESVTLLNNSLFLHIPLISYPQRGKLHLDFFVRYNNQEFTAFKQCLNVCTTIWSANGGDIQVLPDLDYALAGVYENASLANIQDYLATGPDGSSHMMGSTTSHNWLAMDGTGFQYDSTADVLIDSDGVRYSGSAANAYGNWVPAQAEDPNGNVISVSFTPPTGGYATSVTDSLGRSIPMPPSPTTPNGSQTTNFSGCTGTVSTYSAFNWTLPGPNGGSTVFKICYAQFGVGYNPGDCFPSNQDAPCYPYSATVAKIQSIVLPNGTAWTFAYDQYGDLASLTLPTGGTISYGWTLYTIANQPWALPQVTSRSVNANDGTGTHTWTYAPGTTDIVVDPDGNQTVHTFGEGSCPVYAPTPFLCDYETQVQYYQNVNGTQNLLKTVATAYQLSAGSGYFLAVPSSITTTWADGRVAQTQKTYDTGIPLTGNYSGNAILGQVTEQRDYDYASGSPGALLRRTDTSYMAVSGSTYLTNGLLRLPSTTTTYNGSGTQAAQTTYSYDSYSLNPSGVSSPYLDPAPPDGSYRGNLTSVSRWLNTPSSNVVSTKTYWDTGEAYTSTSPNLNTTTYNYTCTAAYLQTVTDPAGHTTAYSPDCNTGLVLSVTDENNQTTSHQYDPSWRLTQTNYPDGGQVAECYTDTAGSSCASSGPPYAVITTTLLSSGNMIGTEVFDGLGRLSQKQVNSDPAGTDYTDITYDERGMKHSQSNPYRQKTDPTYGVTTYAYDALNRVTVTTNADNSQITDSHAGGATEVTDEGNGTASVQRVYQNDGLGRMISVCEVTSATQSGTSGTPAACAQDIAATGFLTTYAYDALGNLTAASQAGLNPRYYAYDSLSRLISSSNPEAGTITYAYDGDSNVTSRVAPAPNQTNPAVTVTATYGYDLLDRLASKTYSDGTTPSVAMTYDAQPSNSPGTLNYPTGRLVEASVGNAITWESYDRMGRPAEEWQCTPVNCGSGAFALPYTYGPAGEMLTFTNGAGVTFTNVYDTASQLMSVASSLQDSNHPSPMLSSVQYAAFGGVTSLNMGNGAAESVSYTSRLWAQSMTATGTTLVNPAMPGTGSATVSGTLQTIPSTPAAAGSGSVIISGVEAQKSGGDPCWPADHFHCPTTLYDNDTVSITVNGVTDSTVSLQGSTSATVATALGNAIDADPNMPVTAAVSSSTVTLTAKTTGSGTNYSLSTASTGSAGFGACFTPTPSGATLTGGANAVATVYDSGTAWVTVNGFQASVSYGQGSTSSSLASAIAAIFNSGGSSPVTASVSGSVITLTATQTGAATNYSLSAGASTSQPTQFSQPSFTVAVSGSSLTGGANANTLPGVVYSFSLGFAPDGDTTSVTDSVNGSWAYAYDSFNRLASATQGGSTAYTYGYDRYGNRWQDYLNGNCQAGTTSCLSFDANNHVTGGILTYDAAGNVTADNMHHYTYDAENRIIQVDGGATAVYTYDASGNRAVKTSSAGTVYYLYDLAGREITEINSSGGWNRTEVYAGGKHLATYSGGATGTTYFIHSDWLGTERARTNNTGISAETCTSLPFGDGQSCTGIDVSPMHFTGKQRDTETGNDDFGARYYSSNFGRWMTPDWSAREEAVPYADLRNPQTLDLYAYVDNNPTTHTDPDGHTRQAPDSGCGQAQGGGDAAGSVCSSSTTNEQTTQEATTGGPNKAQNTNTQQVGNVVHNETGGLRPEAKEGSGGSQDLHNAKVAVADVVENREKAGNNGGVASDKVSSKERNTPQYKDAQQAAAEAARSDVTGGSKHFYLDYGQKPPSWAAGKETTTYGPFKNAAGGGDVPKGADVKIIIVHPENQQ